MGILRTNEISGLETPTAVTGSVLFDGDGDFLTLASSGDFAFSTGKFTTECFFNWTGDNSQFMIHGEASTGNFNLFLESNSINWYNGAATSTITTGITKNVWHHIAVVRESTASNDTKVYLDGNLVGSFTSNTNYSSISILIGKNQTSGGVYADGYISNLRILKGTALYTSDFTPPVHELQPIGDTVLLCCNNPDSAGAEATGKTITVNGNAAASTVSPGLTRDFTFGTQFQGVAKFDTQGYFVPPSGTTEQRGRGRGVFGWGSNPVDTTIDYVTISSMGNAIAFGDLDSSNRWGSHGCASATRGLFAGGYVNTPASTFYNIIDYITIASTGNPITFGELTEKSYKSACCANSTRGLFAHGYTAPSFGISNVISYVTIASLGDSQNFGDLIVDSASGRASVTALSSSTRGVFAGGLNPIRNTIDFVTISTLGDSQEFGDLTIPRGNASSTSSSTRGVIAGGEDSPSTLSDVIDFITIASTGDAQDFGNLITATRVQSSSSNNSRAIFGGGYIPSTVVNTINYVTIASTGNAQDFGDLTSGGRRDLGGFSDSHGGIS